LITGDSKDKDIIYGKNDMLWAKGDQDTLSYH